MKKTAVIIASVIIAVAGVILYFIEDIQNMFTGSQNPTTYTLSFKQISVESSVIKNIDGLVHIRIPQKNVQAMQFLNLGKEGYCILGNIREKNKPVPRGILLTKFSVNDQLEWAKVYEVNEGLFAMKVISLQSGMIILGEHTPSASLINAFILKTDMKGNMQWATSIGENKLADRLAHIVENENGYMAAGTSTDGFNVTFTGPNSMSMKPGKLKVRTWLVMLNKTGQVTGGKLLKEFSSNYDLQSSQTSNNYLLYVGPYDTPQEITINAKGEVQSKKALSQFPKNITEANKYIYGNKFRFENFILDKSNKEEFKIIKLSQTDAPVWTHTIKASNSLGGDHVKIFETSDGGCLIEHFQYEFMQGGTLLIKLSTDGKEEWRESFQSKDGRYIFVDHIERQDDNHLWLAKKSYIADFDFSTENILNGVRAKAKIESYSEIVLVKGNAKGISTNAVSE